MIQPTKVRLLKCVIDGVNMIRHCQSIRVYESMCKPYITAQIYILDNNNIVNSLRLRGGEKVDFAFDCGYGAYEQSQLIHSVKGEESERNLRSILYVMETVGPAYFKDRSSTVQESFKNITGTNAVQKIFNQYLGGDAPLNIKGQSLGMIAKNEIGSYIVNNMKPMKAIDDIFNRITYGQQKSGSTMLFRDAKSYQLGPLEDFFKGMGSQHTFIEKASWGSDYRDMFEAAHSAIMAATTVVKEGAGGGAGAAGNIANATNQGKHIVDLSKSASAISEMGRKISAGFSMGGNIKLPNISGSTRNGQNIFSFDSARNALSSDASINSPHAKLFQALVADGTQYYIKVPIRYGIECTVGKGITCKLMPPIGDGIPSSSNYGGNMLVADVVHECFFDQREVQATTTFRCVKGGLG